MKGENFKRQPTTNKRVADGIGPGGVGTIGDLEFAAGLAAALAVEV